MVVPSPYDTLWHREFELDILCKILPNCSLGERAGYFSFSFALTDFTFEFLLATHSYKIDHNNS